MPRFLTPDLSLDRLKKEAKRWLKAIRASDAAARARFLTVLPNEARALEVAALLVAHGADPAIRDPQGLTAADRAERNAMYQVAALLREAEARR